MRQTCYEFHVYSGDTATGIHSDVPERFYEHLASDSRARSMAGRLAKKSGGPVDLAYAEKEDWSERYITTASPSEYHSAGYRFERLGA